MSKPEWKDAPEWANYLSQDADGDWTWWEAAPTFSEENSPYWMPSKEAIHKGLYNFTTASSCAENTDWKETLESRP